MDDNDSKKINITGTNNKYKIKQLLKFSQEKEVKKRLPSDNWTFDIQHNDNRHFKQSIAFSR